MLGGMVLIGHLEGYIWSFVIDYHSKVLFR